MTVPFEYFCGGIVRRDFRSVRDKAFPHPTVYEEMHLITG